MFAGFLVGSGICPQGDDPGVLNDEVVGDCGEVVPVRSQTLEQVVYNGLWPNPGSAVVGESFGLSPLRLAR